VDYFEIEDIEESSALQSNVEVVVATNHEKEKDDSDEDYDEYLAKLEQVSDSDWL